MSPCKKALPTPTKSHSNTTKTVLVLSFRRWTTWIPSKPNAPTNWTNLIPTGTRFGRSSCHLHQPLPRKIPLQSKSHQSSGRMDNQSAHPAHHHSAPLVQNNLGLPPLFLVDRTPVLHHCHHSSQNQPVP